MIYEATYRNGQKTVTYNFESIVLFAKEMQVIADVRIWNNGNCIMAFELNPYGYN